MGDEFIFGSKRLLETGLMQRLKVGLRGGGAGNNENSGAPIGLLLIIENNVLVFFIKHASGDGESVCA